MNQTVPVNVKRDELLAAMRYDCVTFFSFYLGEELTLEVPEFHISIWEELLQLVEQLDMESTTITLQKLFAVPREHSKSTTAKLATILFLKYTTLSFVLYVSKTNGIAKNAIRDILMWLALPQERELYGPIATIKSSETESLWIVDITTRLPGEEPRVKRSIFKALGSEQQVRGLLINNKRPEIIVIDDVEDLDNTKDEDQQRTLDEWVVGSLMKARAKRAVIIFLGNMIRKTTLLARLAKNKEWNPTVFGCLVRDKATGILQALWPSRHTVDGLLADYRMHRGLGLGHVWECEMMNLTQDEASLEDMSGSRIVEFPSPEQLTAGAIVLDPAFGLEKMNDPSAITVHAMIDGVGVPAVIDSWEGRVKEEILFDEMLRLSYHWGIYTWFIEADAAQRLFIPFFDLLVQQRQLPREMIIMLPVFTNQASKPSRIVAFRNAVKSGSYAIADTQTELLDRLGAYNPRAVGSHDDLEDCSAYGTVIWQKHERILKERGIQRIPLSMWQGDPKVASRSELQTTSC